MTFALTGVEEARGRVGATMTGRGGRGGPDREPRQDRTSISDHRRIRLAASGTRKSPSPSRGPIRYRLDGSAWLTVTEPVALNGHRFRLEHGSEQVLMTALQPADFFLRPVPGGVVVWANWPLAPFGIPQDDPPAAQLGVEYRLTVEITG